MNQNQFEPLPIVKQNELLVLLEKRFKQNKKRHPNVTWEIVEKKLLNDPKKLWSVCEMERTGGDPDVIVFSDQPLQLYFADFSKESPISRRSFCYDRLAWEMRKHHKPENNVIDYANNMGIELMDETQYRELQTFDEFDKKTSSWILTPTDIRKLGGAIFADRRYDHIFIYHNGADSYYASRGFRGILKI